MRARGFKAQDCSWHTAHLAVCQNIQLKECRYVKTQSTDKRMITNVLLVAKPISISRAGQISMGQAT